VISFLKLEMRGGPCKAHSLLEVLRNSASTAMARLVRKPDVGSQHCKGTKGFSTQGSCYKISLRVDF